MIDLSKSVHQMHACQRHASKVANHKQVRMGDAWLKGKEYGNCDREIDYEDLGRWFRCASKVRIRSTPCVVQTSPCQGDLCICDAGKSVLKLGPWADMACSE